MPPNLISLYIVAAMVGIMVFFTIAVAPTVFKVLPPEWSSKYVRRFFPKYYAFLCFACIAASLLASDALISTLTFLCAILFAIAQCGSFSRPPSIKPLTIKTRSVLVFCMA